MSRRVSFAVLLVVASLAARAEADPPIAGSGSDAPRSEADRLFREGVYRLTQGRWQDACELLGESQRLEPASGTALDLGYCSDKLGRTASALAAYEDAIRLAQGPRRAERVGHARAALAELEPRLCRLQIATPNGSPITVTVDGRLWADPTRPRAFDPGEHVVGFSAQGKQPAERVVRIEGTGQRLTLTAPSLVDLPAESRAGDHGALAPLTAEDSRRGFVSDGSSRPSRVPAIATVAGGSAALGLGAVAGLFAMNAHATSNRECTFGCTAEGVRAEDEARTWARVSTVGFAAGIVALGIGTWLWLRAR